MEDTVPRITPSVTAAKITCRVCGGLKFREHDVCDNCQKTTARSFTSKATANRTQHPLFSMQRRDGRPNGNGTISNTSSGSTQATAVPGPVRVRPGGVAFNEPRPSPPLPTTNANKTNNANGTNTRTTSNATADDVKGPVNGTTSSTTASIATATGAKRPRVENQKPIVIDLISSDEEDEDDQPAAPQAQPQPAQTQQDAAVAVASAAVPSDGLFLSRVFDSVEFQDYDFPFAGPTVIVPRAPQPAVNQQEVTVVDVTDDGEVEQPSHEHVRVVDVESSKSAVPDVTQQPVVSVLDESSPESVSHALPVAEVVGTPTPVAVERTVPQNSLRQDRARFSEGTAPDQVSARGDTDGGIPNSRFGPTTEAANSVLGSDGNQDTPSRATVDASRSRTGEKSVHALSNTEAHIQSLKSSDTHATQARVTTATTEQSQPEMPRGTTTTELQPDARSADVSERDSARPDPATSTLSNHSADSRTPLVPKPSTILFSQIPIVLVENESEDVVEEEEQVELVSSNGLFQSRIFDSVDFAEADFATPAENVNLARRTGLGRPIEQLKRGRAPQNRSQRSRDMSDSDVPSPVDDTRESHPSPQAIKSEPNVLKPRKKVQTEPSSNANEFVPSLHAHAEPWMENDEKPPLGYCTPEFLSFMRDCADFGEDDEEGDAIRAKLLEVVDLTHLSDASDDDEESDGYIEDVTPSYLQNGTSVTTPADTAQQIAGNTVDAGKVKRTRAPRPKETCVLCEEKVWIKALIHCKTCSKYYHKKCAREYGDEALCWNCELDDMIDNTEQTEADVTNYVAMFTAFREAEENDRSGDGDALSSSSEQAADPADESVNTSPVPPPLRSTKTKSMRRWEKFLAATAPVDESFEAMTNQIVLERKADTGQSYFSKGFTTREIVQSAMDEVVDHYAELQDEEERSRLLAASTTTSSLTTTTTPTTTAPSPASSSDAPALPTPSLELPHRVPQSTVALPDAAKILRPPPPMHPVPSNGPNPSTNS